MRTYRPEPVMFKVWVWNAGPYAASHCSTTCVMLRVAPRSTSSHCGSEKALDQRVPVLPSVALAAGVPAFSCDEAVVGLPCDSRVGAACAAVVNATSMYTVMLSA